jgi:hypothetical protein
VEVGAADPARRDANEHFAARRNRLGDVVEPNVLSGVPPQRFHVAGQSRVRRRSAKRQAVSSRTTVSS